MEKTWIYHFTHRDNLRSIVEQGALICDRDCASLRPTIRSIAYSHIKKRRTETLVEAGPGGYLDEYVPFYFGPRSSMLYAYRNGKVTGRPENLDEIIYLTSTAEHVAGMGLQFVFTDGHPTREPKAFYDKLTDLAEVDLKLMYQQYHFDTDDDPDRKRRRQAEFLIHRRVPLEAILAIGVRNHRMASWTQTLIGDLGGRIRCVIRPKWHYDYGSSTRGVEKSDRRGSADDVHRRGSGASRPIVLEVVVIIPDF